MYTLYAGKTDFIPFKSSDWNTYTKASGVKNSNYMWYDGSPLPEQKNLWQVGTRIVTNPIPDLRVIITADGGYLGATNGAYADAASPAFTK